MTFISYAQNFEDVMLHRALAGVAKGFYLDIGAGDPDIDSVTRLFYEGGWRGVNVEPMKSVYERLVAARPRDVNLNVAVEDAIGDATYYSVDDEGGLSTGDSALAEAHQKAGSTIAEVGVTTTTLAEVCAAHAPAQIHFLKIDVEGLEDKVLRGADFELFRPWIIVAESLHKGEIPPVADEWEAILIAARYEFVYYDGLNRFYVSQEHSGALRAAFTVPPNYFDEFTLARVSQLERLRQEVARALGSNPTTDVREVATRLGGLVEDRVRFEQLAASRQIELDSMWQASFEDDRQIAWLSAQLNNVAYERHRDQIAAAQALAVALADVDVALADAAELRASTSWKLTRPVRAVSSALRSRRGRGH